MYLSKHQERFINTIIERLTVHVVNKMPLAGVNPLLPERLFNRPSSSSEAEVKQLHTVLIEGFYLIYTTLFGVYLITCNLY